MPFQSLMCFLKFLMQQWVLSTIPDVPISLSRPVGSRGLLLDMYPTGFPCEGPTCYCDRYNRCAYTQSRPLISLMARSPQINFS